MTDNKNQQNIVKSNDEIDQDEGNMNNGTIGGDIGIRGGNTEEDQSDNSIKAEGAGSKTLSAGTNGSSGHIDENTEEK